MTEVNWLESLRECEPRLRKLWAWDDELQYETMREWGTIAPKYAYSHAMHTAMRWCRKNDLFMSLKEGESCACAVGKIGFVTPIMPAPDLLRALTAALEQYAAKEHP